jgi:pimeloyl-ACP methyl ester carboxylesterase
MATRDEAVDIAVDDQSIAGTLVVPATLIPGFLFVHGWGGNQDQYLARAREIAALGCICLTFDLRGHARTEPQNGSVTREDNLRDLMAAFDALAGNPAVDRSAIAVIGSSYGRYLAAILTTLRPVRWLGLRVPALYKDEDWAVPKRRLDKDELAAYRRRPVSAEENRALRACARFAGDVLVVESEHDDIVPHPTIASYRAAFERARSLTYRVIKDADHGLSEPAWQHAYTALLLKCTTEMVLSARESGTPPSVLARGDAEEPGEDVIDELARR